MEMILQVGLTALVYSGIVVSALAAANLARKLRGDAELESLRAKYLEKLDEIEKLEERILSLEEEKRRLERRLEEREREFKKILEERDKYWEKRLEEATQVSSAARALYEAVRAGVVRISAEGYDEVLIHANGEVLGRRGNELKILWPRKEEKKEED